MVDGPAGDPAMDDGRWRRIDALFEAALDLPAADRAALLDRECAGDPGLRRAVERLLALEAEAGDFLSRPIVPETPETVLAETVPDDPETPEHEPAADELAGRRIGPYRLIRALGHGGMGSVYLARREDDYRQEVAIKLVRRGLLDGEARRRLAVERQALARLEHPNVARLYDGGTTDDGLPYLVMERVEGVPIDRYCDRHRLSVRRRIELFLPVLGAVAHAHHQLWVHCDLKPSNVLVTADGTPKLLDFGIAKLLRPEAGSEVAVTLAGLRPMTLAYASPEQVKGGPITTASDVYSLGVLLNELLCGRLPYTITGDPRLEMPRAIVEQDPDRPSRQVTAGRRPWPDPVTVTRSQLRGATPRELERQLRGDLDAIVTMAIRKEPEERYPSVEALARDLTRHLEARPVSARRGGWRYRGSRFLRRLLWPPDPQRRRERWSWAAALVVVVVGSWAALDLRRPPDPCAGSAERLAGVWGVPQKTAVARAFLATDLPFAGDSWRRVETALDRRAAEWIATRDELCRATHHGGDLSPRLLDLGRLCLDGRRDELRALVELFRVADEKLVIGAVGAVGQLGDLQECTDAAELATRTLPPVDPELRRRLDAVRAVVEEQSLRLRIDQPVDFDALRRSEAELRQLEAPALLSRALHVLGRAESDEGGAPEEGEAHLEEALRAAIAGGDRPQQARIYAALVKTLARQQGEFERARFWAGFGRAALDALGPGYDQLEYEMLHALGSLEWHAGDFSRAKEHFLRALEIAEAGSDPIRRIRTLNQLGLFGDGRHHLERAVTLIEQELGPDHVLLAPPLLNLASHFAYGNHYDQALTLARRSFELTRATYGDRHPDLAIPGTLIGQLLIATDRPEEAIEPLEAALRRLEEGTGPKMLLRGEVRVALGEALLLVGELEKSAGHLRRAADLFAELPPGHPSRLNLETVSGDLARESGDLDRAVAVHEALAEKLQGPGSPHGQMKSLLAIGRTRVAAGRLAAAVPMLEDALEATGENRQLAAAARTRFALARALWRADPPRARRLLEEARASLTDDLPLHRRIRSEIDDWRLR